MPTPGATPANYAVNATVLASLRLRGKRRATRPPCYAVRQSARRQLRVMPLA